MSSVSKLIVPRALTPKGHSFKLRTGTFTERHQGTHSAVRSVAPSSASHRAERSPCFMAFARKADAQMAARPREPWFKLPIRTSTVQLLKEDLMVLAQSSVWLYRA